MTLLVKNIINIDDKQIIIVKFGLKNKKEITNILDKKLIKNEKMIVNKICSFLEYETEIINQNNIYRKIFKKCNRETIYQNFQLYVDYEKYYNI